ncbi:hypothetical protein [Paraburkholderia metrosideri]|uniref:Uncharacterized protein n=1 Tax=Paraburkholderia metrosideri TaxID=580937 RepID=A0ABM8P1R5_9BURK|nr:hypothetical protein [Paraburkholderia metrosideri]CAD6553512.1 hypothetical protein LMG28140_05311 [Paraburkholderia metrosideri]
MRENDNAATQGALPINDTRWFGFPLEARYASGVASAAGLHVAIEGALIAFPATVDEQIWIARIHGATPASADTPRSFITWTGTEAQFRASEYFTGPFPRKRRWSCPEGLRGHLWRTGADEFSYVIESVSTSGRSRPPVKQVARALACESYRAFRERLLSSPLSSE